MQQREALRGRKERLIRTDFGAHGRQPPFIHRSWKDELSEEVRPPWLHRLLHHLVALRAPRRLVEVGAAAGLGTMALAAACGQSSGWIAGLEGDPKVRQEAKRLALAAARSFPAWSQPEWYGDRVENALPALLPEWKPLDLVVLDTLPRYEAIYPVGQQLLDALSEQGLLVIIAPYRSPSATQAWEALKQLPQVWSSVDAYHLGVLAVDRGLNPEHRMLRLWG